MGRLDRWWQSNPLLRLVAVTVGYVLLGAVVTGAVALVVLNVTLHLQTEIYHVFYLRVGPGDATVAAILGQFLFASFTGVVVAMAVAEWLNDSEQKWRGVGGGAMALLSLLAISGVLVFLGLPIELTVLGVLAVGFLGILVLLRYRYGIRSGSVPAVLGSIPVVMLILLLAGFGIGWGWGYVMVAEEVPQASVDGPVADFDAVPTVRDDLLLRGDCVERDGRTRCRLQLRGYAHAETAVQWMDSHGVRCPAQSASGGDSGAFYAKHDGTTYRVSCTPHGD